MGNQDRVLKPVARVAGSRLGGSGTVVWDWVERWELGRLEAQPVCGLDACNGLGVLQRLAVNKVLLFGEVMDLCVYRGKDRRALWIILRPSARQVSCT